MLTKLAKSLRGAAENWLESRGYSTVWMPLPMIRNPEAQIHIDLDFVLAHLLLTKKDVFFVEIGANDGVANDPLYRFVKEFGWHGVLLEPLPEIFEKLQANYAGVPNVQLLNCAIGHEDGELPFYTIRIEEGTFRKAHQFSSFLKSAVLSQGKYVPNVADLIEERKVRVLGMKSLLDQIGDRHIDVLQIDVEGFDAEVVRMIPFDRIKPTIIHYEHSMLSKDDQNDCAQRLIDQGYKLMKDGLDTTAYRMP